MSTQKFIVGIDYSMSSPAMVTHIGNQWSSENCSFLYVQKKIPSLPKDARFKPKLYPSFSSDTERFHLLARVFFDDDLFKGNDITSIFIENYAMGASGRLATIGENTGFLKSFAFTTFGKVMVAPSPAEIKKFATGKGTAKKEDMLEAFYSEKGFTKNSFDIHDTLGIKKFKKDGSLNLETVSDIVDAYFICKLGFERTDY